MVNDGGKPGDSIVPVKGKKFRKGTPKSRNGCTTCKIRRIKCDETKPACLKCTHTGRTCDGYSTCHPPANSNQPLSTTQASPAAPVAVTLRNPLLDFSGTELEHRFLTFFYRHTTPIISGCFDSDFWGELLPRVGCFEPTIQHAMIAVGAVHSRLEAVDERFDRVGKREESRRFELQQYNKAISHLRDHLSANGVTIEVTLSCCVLLICLELLRGSIEQAILHLRGGMSILRDYHATSTHRLTEKSHRVSSSSDAMARKLEDIFYRLGIQWTLCGGSATSSEDIDFDSGPLTLSQTFSSFEEARLSLDQLNNLCLRFVHLSMEGLYSPSQAGARGRIEDSLSVTHAWLSAQLQNWSDTFESLITKERSKTDPRFSAGSTFLRMAHLTAVIWLSVSTSPMETAFDDKLREFSSIVELASSLERDPSSCLDSSAKPSGSGPFSFTFEMGAIAPLYFTAIKCRDPIIRRKAISLLSSNMPRREGLWDAEILEYVARRLVDMEEAGLNGFGEHSTARAGENLLPAEDDRVAHVTIHYEQDWQHQGKKCCSVTYMMKPIAGSEDWVSHHEDVVLGGGTTYRQSRETTITKTAHSAIALATTAFQLRGPSQNPLNSQ